MGGFVRGEIINTKLLPEPDKEGYPPVKLKCSIISRKEVHTALVTLINEEAEVCPKTSRFRIFGYKFYVDYQAIIESTTFWICEGSFEPEIENVTQKAEEMDYLEVEHVKNGREYSTYFYVLL